MEDSHGFVKYAQGEIKELIQNEEGTGVRGVRLTNGKTIEAKKVVLATGAWTSAIMSPLEDRLNLKERERMESQVRAAGVAAVHWRLSAEEKRKYEQMPVIIYGQSGRCKSRYLGSEICADKRGLQVNSSHQRHPIC